MVSHYMLYVCQVIVLHYQIVRPILLAEGFNNHYEHVCTVCIYVCMSVCVCICYRLISETRIFQMSSQLMEHIKSHNYEGFYV